MSAPFSQHRQLNDSIQKVLDSDPLVIADFQVLAHKIMHGLLTAIEMLGQTGDRQRREDILGTWLRANWTALLSRLSPELPLRNYKLLLVNDKKIEGCYWRHEFAPDYKANRKPKTSEFNLNVEVGLEIAEKMGVPVLSLSGYEADDLAGWLVANLEEPLVLLTIDTDWLQLVNDRVVWCNTAHYTPVLRGDAEAIAWCKRRLRRDIASARGIADVKCEVGDKSDNLPPGTSKELIGLFPEDYPKPIRLEMDSHKQEWLTAASTAPRVDTEWYYKSSYWCRKVGLECVL